MKRTRTSPRYDLTHGKKTQWFHLRRRLNLTQAVVAAAIGRSKLSVHNYESGKWAPPPEVVIAYEALALKHSNGVAS